MGPHLLRREDHRVMRWANGAGTTREVAREDGPDGFDWRLSFADVTTSGPFSPLPGVDRVITLVEGAGLRLDLEGETRVLAPFAPYRFRGEDAVHGTPDGPSVDLNVMTRRGRWDATVTSERVDADAALVLEGTSGLRFVAVLDGSPVLEGRALRRYDVVRAGVEELTLTGTGRVAVVDLRPGDD